MRVESWRAVLGLALALAIGCGDSAPKEEKRAAVTPVDPATAASVEVVVNYRGEVPPPRQINMSSEPECAAQHESPAYEDLLVVKDGKLENAVVWIKDGLGERGFATPESPVQIDQKGCMYKPHVAGVMVGQPLEFINSDHLAHNVHGHPDRVRAWNFMMPRPNTTRQLTFDKSEVAIPVRCDIHPWMLAYVAVFEHPYFGVTGEDGTVTLKNVPPGQYTLGIWHEKLGTREIVATLEAKQSAKVDVTYEAR